MSTDESALALLDLDDSTTEKIFQRLAEETFNVAEIISNLRVFTASATPERLEDLPAQTIEIRRSHLAYLIAVLDAGRQSIAEIFRSIDLDGRIPDADMLEPVHDGLATAGEGLAAIVNVLHNPYR